jgi:hypothetical protein
MARKSKKINKKIVIKIKQLEQEKIKLYTILPKEKNTKYICIDCEKEIKENHYIYDMSYKRIFHIDCFHKNKQINENYNTWQYYEDIKKRHLNSSSLNFEEIGIEYIEMLYENIIQSDLAFISIKKFIERYNYESEQMQIL